MPTDPLFQVQSLARFPVNLPFPDAPAILAADAGEAIRREHRSSVRWKRLRCRKVEPLSNQPGNTIFILEVGRCIEFDWSWEGAVAFRPVDPGSFTRDQDVMDDFTGMGSNEDSSDGPKDVWSGEIVGVDETNGRIFVATNCPEHPPRTGSFLVRPFEFLAFLYAVFFRKEFESFKNRLPSRLNAAQGNVHPPVSGVPSLTSLPELRQLWGHAWGILWGPPGTGKTHTLGRQVAECLNDPTERILVVSTTNQATDAAALSVGRAALALSPRSLEEGRILRIGKRADHGEFQGNGLEAMLRGTETDLLQQLNELSRQRDQAIRHEDKAVLQQQIQELRRSMKDSAFNIFASPDVQVVVSTAFKAITLLNDPSIRSLVAASEAPFTTLLIDEAGLLSRAVIAVLSLLASRRIVVVGDGRQLAPISKISRILPTTQSIWLASSGLSHLQSVQELPPGVHLLRDQHRMHPDVSRVVSHFQYEGTLHDAPVVSERTFALPPVFKDQPRAVWYVLDEDGDDLAAIRAERGPGNRSWIRQRSRHVLEKLFTDPKLRQARGLFITPFRAQAKEITGYLAGEKLDTWSAGTVHGRQGTEAEVVIFDTVNAGSCGWPYDEWKRLVNVGLSRAREIVIVLASRAEMNEPYLRPLTLTLAPLILSRSGRALEWKKVSVRATFRPVISADAVPPDGEEPAETAHDPDLLGNQLERRKSLRPVMSAEQQRLCGYNMDGKPRLVRGVAGSGKTAVLAHWLQKTVRKMLDRPHSKIWAVYANRTLHRLIADTIDGAWQAEGDDRLFPWERVELWHVRDILAVLLLEVGLGMGENDYDYDAKAASYLERKPFEQIKSRCDAMFIDEGQDMGPSAIQLLSALVKPTDAIAPQGRPVNIFYDNAQNIYGRRRPTWSEIGLDMRGRSTVMKESYRSTRPITEYALNVLYRLQPPGNDPDHRELVDRGLIELTTRCEEPWWNVRFNQVEGPAPLFKRYETLDQQLDALTEQLIRWIRDEGVKPGDICILYNGSNIRYRLEKEHAARLQEIGARFDFQKGTGADRSEDAVLVSTVQSFKGYEAEIVVIASVEQFVIEREKRILANNLYVAMTRARSVLAVYAYARKNEKEPKSSLLGTLQDCLENLVERPEVEQEISNIDDFEDLVQQVGPHRKEWLETLWRRFLIHQEPILASDREILAEPLFWFQVDDHRFACFGDTPPRANTRNKLEEAGIEILLAGDNVPGAKP